MNKFLFIAVAQLNKENARPFGWAFSLNNGTLSPSIIVSATVSRFLTKNIKFLNRKRRRLLFFAF
jgi:hypothetical protein